MPTREEVDEMLLRRAVGSAWCDRPVAPRWVGVAARFQVSPEFARKLCTRFGFDTDEIVGSKIIGRNRR